MHRPARILVMRGGAIGDFIVTLPALAALRHRWPDSHIELIAYPHIARLAVAGGFANHIRPIHDPLLARYFAPDAPLRDEDQRYFSSFDFVLQFTQDPNGCLAENLKRCGVQVLIHASPVPTEKHAADHFLDALKSLAIYDAPASVTLKIQPSPDVEPRSPAQPWLAIHPGSGSRSKNWPLDHFIALAGRARTELGLNTCFISGDAELEFIPDLDSRLSNFPRIQSVDLIHLSMMLQKAAAYIGNDSGISHLAAALGVPSLALFGPTDPHYWAPRGQMVKILRSRDRTMPGLHPEEAWDALVKLIDAAN